VAVALDELHDQRSDGGHRSSLEESYGNVSGKNRASFQAQIPCKLQVIVKKNTSKSRGFLRPFWGMNQQFRYGENDIFFQNAQNAGAVFPPAGCFCLLNCVAQKHDNVRCGLGP